MLVNMKNLLADAQKRHYAVGLFNTIDTDMLEAAVTAAEKQRSPIIIGTAECLLPYGELKLIAPSMIAAAERAAVPVTVHFDHGLTFERCMEAMNLGFSSIMFDGSTNSPEENARQTKEIVDMAHARGISVEGEIGHVGEAAQEDTDAPDRFTTAAEAVEFVRRTGVDALAVAIGTAHGVYKRAPHLCLERLEEIRNAVDVPLVLHGGSGLSETDFVQAIKAGISKINIFTDICMAGMDAQKEAAAREMNYMEARSWKVDRIRNEIENKMMLFGSSGKCSMDVIEKR